MSSSSSSTVSTVDPYDSPTVPTVTLPNHTTLTPTAGTTMTSPAVMPSGGLAFTGADVVGTVILGAAIILAGIVAVCLSRARRRQHRS